MIKCWLRLETRLDYDDDVPALVSGRDQNGGVYSTVSVIAARQTFLGFLLQGGKQQWPKVNGTANSGQAE